MKKLITIITFLIIIINNNYLFAQIKWRTLPWAEDKFDSRWGSGIISQYDKMEHFTCYTAATAALDDWKLSLAIGIAWEIKDALIPYEKYGHFWGGDGFSFKDLAANMVGIGTGLFVRRVVIDKLLFPKKIKR